MPVVTVTQAFRYEIAPTQAQVRYLRLCCAAYRKVYNRFVAARNDWWEANKDLPKGARSKPPSANVISAALTVSLQSNDALPLAERDLGLSDIRAAPRLLTVRALSTAEDAFNRWFKRIARSEFSKPPKFKSRHDPEEARFSMSVQTTRVLKAGNIGARPFLRPDGFILYKVGFLKSKEDTSKLKGRPVRVTVSEKAGRWYLSVCCVDAPREVPDRTDTERVGVDLGVRKLATLSTGEFVAPTTESRAGTARAEKRIKRLQRSLSRKRVEAQRLGVWDKHETSKGYQRVRRKLQVASAHLSAQRLDRTNKLTTRLVKEFRTVVIEDLNVQGMTASAAGTVAKPGKNVVAKSRLNRAVRANQFGTLRRKLEYKATWYGSTVETVPRFYPSSKTCSGCGNVKQDLGSKETYHCDACGLTIDRDLNAAINIRDFSPEAQEKLVAKPTGERVDCLKARKGARAGPVKRSKKHVQDPQGKPDAGFAIPLCIPHEESTRTNPCSTDFPTGGPD